MAAPSQPSLLDRVFAATSTEESRALYEEWATTYDSDMAKHEFIAPRLVAEAVLRVLGLNYRPDQKEALSNITIADAGCGTGLVGIELLKLGADIIDGLDISEGMLDLARLTGVYRDLKITDLTARIPIADEMYDTVTCCGTFTHGHLGPEPLAELLRIVKIGGVVVASVLDTHWEEKGFEEDVERFVRAGWAEVIEKDSHAYRKDAGGGRILVLRKMSGPEDHR